MASRGTSSSATSRLAIVADAEIHNRADLLSRLSSEGISGSPCDAALILAAYAKWGEQCPAFLAGEFSFAIWDEPRQRLFCARDHMGLRPFFYWCSGHRLVFCSDPLPLFSVPGICRELNRVKFGAFSRANFSDDGHPHETFFRGIYSLPPANTLTFEDGRLSTSRYWNPENARVFVPPNDDEAYEALREILFDTVSSRLREKDRAAVFLSGGLDSSALTAIAARCLEKSNRTLPAIAAVLPETSKPHFADEREYIEEFRGYPNVTIDFVAPEDGGPFDGIEDTSFFAAEPFKPPIRYLIDAMHQAAAGHGAEAVLWGGGGELGATAAGREYYLELAFGLRWVSLARELSRFRSVYRRSPVRLMRRVLGDYFDPHRRDVFQPLFLLAPDFLRRIGEVPRPERRWSDLRCEQRDGITAFANCSAFPPRTLLRETFPFLDRRVLEFCLAAPGRLKVRNGYQRCLIREALKDLLPEKIRRRVTKTPFSPDHPRRFRAQLAKAREFAASINRRDPVREIVDVDRLRHLLDLPGTPDNAELARSTLPRTVYLICFLRQFAEFQR